MAVAPVDSRYVGTVLILPGRTRTPGRAHAPRDAD